MTPLVASAGRCPDTCRCLDTAWRAASSADDGGPTAMGPSRRRRPPTSRARSPRGHCPPTTSTHHSGRREDREHWQAGGPAHGDAGTPPPASLAIGPLVVRGISSAPRSYRDTQTPADIELLRVTAKTSSSPTSSALDRSTSRVTASASRSRDEARRTISGAPTMPPGRREGQRPGTQVEGPGAARAAATTIRTVDVPDRDQGGPKPRCGEHVPREAPPSRGTHRRWPSRRPPTMPPPRALRSTPNANANANARHKRQDDHANAVD